MDPKRITAVIVSAILGVILLVTVVAPIVSDGQKDVGPVTTIGNTMRQGDFNYNIWDGSNITISFTVSGTTGTYSINGVEQTSILTYNTQRIVFASNDVCARIGGANSPGTINVQHIGDTNGATYSFTYEIVNGDYTFTQLNHDPITGHVDWLVYAADEGTANLGTLLDPTQPFYTTAADKLVILGNVYTTGENDTFYSYYDGDLTVNEEYTDVSKVEITRTIADGYTDIYSTTVTVNIGDESFSPYFVVAPKAVTGHEATGSLYSMLGVIPIVIAIGVVLGVVSMAIANRYD